MADIAAGDVTYVTIQSNVDGGRGARNTVTDITFGDGVDTYPSGGVPITVGKIGAPVSLETVNFVEPDAGNGFVYKYDVSADTIRIYQGDNDNAADAPLIELVGGAATPAAATVRLEARGY